MSQHLHAPLVTSDILLGLREVSVKLGFPLNRWLQKFGISPDSLDKSESYVSMIAVADLLTELAYKYGSPELGIRIAQRRPRMRFGILTLLIQVCPDVETALHYGHKYIELASDTTIWEMRTRGKNTRISRTDRYGFGGDLTQLHLLSITQYYELLSAFLGERWRPKAMYFVHAAPANTAYYQKAFGAPLLFEQAFNGIEFPKTDLKIPISSSDPALMNSILNYLELQARSRKSNDVYSRVREHIRKRLGSRACSLKGVASYLGIHPKALQRELGKSQKTFRDLLLEVRIEVAQYYLEHSEIPLKQLASILGYSSLATFSRAFKSECNISPKYWRKSRKKIAFGT